MAVWRCYSCMYIQQQHHEYHIKCRSACKCTFIFLMVMGILTACGRTDTGTVVRSKETAQPDVATALALIASVTPVDADYNAQEKDLIANLRRELDRPNISPEARKAIQEKIDVIQRQVQARAYGRLHPAPKDGQQNLAPSQPTSTPVTGIVSDFSPPFPAAQFIATNLWQDFVNGRLVFVYAGARGNDPSQGIVIVQTEGVDGPAGNFDLPTPVKAGVVKIVAARGTVLTLQARNGTTFIFDLLARTLQQTSS